jgi:hypothetical protein
MTTVAQVAEKMQGLLTTTADRLGRETGFIQRERKWSGGTFARVLVFGWMGDPGASLSDMSQAAANIKVKVSRQGLAQRFNERAATFMKALLETAIQEEVAGPCVEADLLRQFNGVYLLDSTCVALSKVLEVIWPGCGGSQGENACLKISVVWEMLSGSLSEMELLAGKTHDQQAQGAHAPLPQQSLRLADLGYFKLKDLARLDHDQVYWVSSYKKGSALFVAGQRIDVLASLQASEAMLVALPVEVGVRQRLPARLVAARVSTATLERRQTDLAHWERKKQCRASAQTWALLAWDIYLTNVPSAHLSDAQVLVMARYRWQIELLFKLWKSEGLLDEWRTQNPWRILSEIYAKLMALLFQHWMLLLGTWQRIDRSPTQAFHVTRHFAWQFARELTNRPAFCRTLLLCYKSVASAVRPLRTSTLEA